MSDTTCRREFLRRICQGVGALGVAAPAVQAQTEAREFRRSGMLYRPLGKTDLVVSVLGFGSHTNPRDRLPDLKGSRLTEEGQAHRDRLIEHALDRGVNLVDVYDDSSQFEPMARLVKGKRQKAMISIRHELAVPMREFVDGGLRKFGYLDLCRFPVGDGANLTQKTLEDWDVLRKAKAAGNIRAIGISTHGPEDMLACVKGLEGLDFVMFPYNFIHARVTYGELVPAAMKRGVALIAIKPLGAGSIVRLDPRRPRPKASLETEDLSAAVPVGDVHEHIPVLEEAADKLRDELDRSPDETLPQAALRFVYSKPFISSVLTGMYLEEELQENCQALMNYAERKQARLGVLGAARELAALSGDGWLPSCYRWLDQRWKPRQLPVA